MDIQLKYKGGRSLMKVMYERKPYVFKKDNDFTCECPQRVIDWLAQNATGQFQVQPTKTVIKEVEVEKPKTLKCDECEFTAKSEYGLLVHKRKHRKGGKK